MSLLGEPNQTRHLSGHQTSPFEATSRLLSPVVSWSLSRFPCPIFLSSCCLASSLQCSAAVDRFALQIIFFFMCPREQCPSTHCRVYCCVCPPANIQDLQKSSTRTLTILCKPYRYCCCCFCRRRCFYFLRACVYLLVLSGGNGSVSGRCLGSHAIDSLDSFQEWRFSSGPATSFGTSLRCVVEGWG